MQEQMTQDEIDSLLNNIGLGEFDTSSLESSKISGEVSKRYWNDIKRWDERYTWACYHGDYEYILECKLNLHRAGFSNWLLKRGITREYYYRLMNREAKKRGFNPPFPRWGF
jgi:hypothetical protein